MYQLENKEFDTCTLFSVVVEPDFSEERTASVRFEVLTAVSISVPPSGT